jgi:hypothetical protein
MSYKSTVWEKISAVSAIVAALAAAYTVYQTAKSYEGQLETNRPYFMVSDLGFEPLPEFSF